MLSSRFVVLMSTPKRAAQNLEHGKDQASLSLGGLIIPDRDVPEGVLIKSYGAMWIEIANALGNDWTQAFNIPPEKWEEIIAGAFSKEGYSVTLTPRSGDGGKDVVAVRDGVGSVRILGSVKAYAPTNLVTRAHVHEMLGVVTGDQRATKGIITTTSDFAPRLLDDEGLARAVPYRLELMNGIKLQQWLSQLASEAS